MGPAKLPCYKRVLLYPISFNEVPLYFFFQALAYSVEYVTSKSTSILSLIFVTKLYLNLWIIWGFGESDFVNMSYFANFETVS